jgi:hypothetical protein
MSLKNFNDPIGNRIRDLSACSAVIPCTYWFKLVCSLYLPTHMKLQNYRHSLCNFLSCLLYLLSIGLGRHNHIWSHSLTFTTLARTPLYEGSARRRDLYLTIHTDINAPGGIRTCNPRNRTTADLCLIPRCHSDRNCNILLTQILHPSSAKIFFSALWPYSYGISQPV